ncbi:serine/threonine-protein kinase haspin homolog isoform X7 [Rhipicephalus microplus]|uniref:serine/threonine-protein kinase haspin homolog isoform X7 n=1 Tax=Rhipicephalus microplus TaxID=6941 RepID=UPI003F6D9E49
MALQPCCAKAQQQRHSFGSIVEGEAKFSSSHVHDDDDDDLEDCDLSCFLESSLLTFDDSIDTASPYVPVTSSATKPSRMFSEFLLPCAEEQPNLLPGRSAEDEELAALQASGNCPHSCRRCYNDCMNKLMALCDSQEVVKFNDALRQPFKASKLRKAGETVDSESYMVDTGSKAPTATDTVLQLFSIDTHSLSRVYCSVFSCRKLSDLQMGLTNKCYGFKTIRRILLVDDNLPENFCKAYDEYARSHSRCYQPHPDMRPKEQHYLLVESDYCGPSILHSKLKPAQAISIIGQVACTLAVAERELQFEHRNLLEENIKVLPSTSKNHHFLIDGRTCCVKGAGIKVTLIDDNFSRLTYNNEIFLRMRNYNCVYKDKTAQYLTLERIIKNRWDLFHPETNALWLAYLCGHLSDYLTVPNPTGEWQRRLELLAFMQRDLHRVHSADEFVWLYINKIGHVHADHGYQPHSWGGRRPSGPPIYTGLLSLLRWRDKKKNEDDNPPGHSASPHAHRSGASSAPPELDKEQNK